MTSGTLLAEAHLPDLPDFVAAFAHAPNENVLFGPGVIEQVGDYIYKQGWRHVLIVTDPGIAAAGHLDRLCQILAKSNIAYQSFTDVEENPTTTVVEACVQAVKPASAEVLIGLGGGSSMDTAKGCNFLYSNGGKMQDYWGHGKATQPMLPFIAIPTTAGTGSECQSYALISDPVTHVKMACGDRKAAACLTVLDPELTISQPPMVTRHTGIDAVTHALESAVSIKGNDISKAYSRASFALLAKGFAAVLAAPADMHARSQMLLGSALAGVAIENSMLGAAHACANPLTAHFNVVHGEAVGVMLSHVMRLNLTDLASREMYDSLAACIGLTGNDLPAWFHELLVTAGLPTSLQHWNVTESHLPQLAADAAKQWTGTFNPVPVNAAALEKLYQSALAAHESQRN